MIGIELTWMVGVEGVEGGMKGEEIVDVDVGVDVICDVCAYLNRLESRKVSVNALHNPMHRRTVRVE